jgi:hypothetical protein
LQPKSPPSKPRQASDAKDDGAAGGGGRTRGNTNTDRTKLLAAARLKIAKKKDGGMRHRSQYT